MVIVAAVTLWWSALGVATATATASPGCELVENVDLFGGDLPGGAFPTADAQQCVSGCIAHADCSHFTFINSNCYLKKSGAGAYPNALGVSGSCTPSTVVHSSHGPCAFESGIDFFGFDIPGEQFRGGSKESCAQPCLDHKRCTHFTYIRGRCHLKTSGAGKTTSPGSVGAICVGTVPRAGVTADGISKPALELCSLDEFNESMDALLDPKTGLLSGWGDQGRQGAVIERYAKVAAAATCQGVPSKRWPMSTGRSTPLIINAGEGSTATRFLNCVMRRCGWHGAHTRGGPGSQKDNATEFVGCDKYNSCTEGWDGFNYISDSPVAYMLPELIASHPDALVIQSLRDPAAWKASRIKKHLHQGAADWHQAGICGSADHPMNHSLTELDYVVYNTWAHCIAPKTGRPGRYLLMNLFKQGSHAAIMSLLLFMRSHKMELIVHISQEKQDKVHTYRELAVALEETCLAEAEKKTTRLAEEGGNRTLAKAAPALRKHKPNTRRDLGIITGLIELNTRICIGAQPDEYGGLVPVDESPIVAGDTCSVTMFSFGFGRGRNLANRSYIDPTFNIGRCCKACNDEPKCVGWSINRALKSCFLKKDLGSPDGWNYNQAATSNVIASGIKPGPGYAHAAPPKPERYRFCKRHMEYVVKVSTSATKSALPIGSSKKGGKTRSAIIEETRDEQWRLVQRGLHMPVIIRK